MWLLNFNQAVGAFTVFEHEKISEPGFYGCIERAFPICGPKIKSAAHGFFGSVVKIVAKRWSYLGFCFKSKQALTIFHHKQIPLFSRTKKTWQLKGMVGIYIGFWNTCFQNNVR